MSNEQKTWVCIINAIPWKLKNLISICVEGNWVCMNLPPRDLPFCWIYHISKVFIVLAYVQEFCYDLISCDFFHICVHRKDLNTSKLMKSLIQKKFDELTKCVLTKHI